MCIAKKSLMYHFLIRTISSYAHYSLEASKAKPAGGRSVVVLIDFFACVRQSVSQTVTLKMNSDWANLAHDQNRYTDWRSVNYVYYVTIICRKFTSLTMR